MNPSNKQLNIIITAGAFLAFAIFGFMDNLKGPLLPVLLTEFNLSYIQGSNILLMLYLGFMLSILGSGFIAGKYGNKDVLLIAGIIISLSAAGMSTLQTQWLLYPFFFSIGIALGSIEVGANGIITDIYHEKSGKYLNLLSVFHGAGSMAAPGIFGILLRQNLPWQTVYRGSFFIILLFPLTFIIVKLSSSKSVHKDISAVQIQKSSIIEFNLFLLAFLLFFYVASEIGLSSWLVDYLYKEKKFTIESSSLMLTVFWAFMMTGRFIASLIVERTGYVKILITTALLALLSFSLGLLPVKFFTYFLPLTGLFFALIFPTITALAASMFPDSKARILSFLFFFAGLGGMVGPWIVGFTADHSGISGGFPLLLIFISGVVILLFVLKYRLRQKL